MISKGILKEPLFRTKVWFIAGCDAKEAIETIKKSGYTVKDDWFEDAIGITIKARSSKETVFFIVWVEKEDDTGCLSHECLHLAREVMDYVGIPVDSKNDEVIAYIQEYWFNRLKKFINL